MKRAIEESFPIVEINKLAVPERNSFKPIYQMHKWFARRSSSVFRAILLAALKPAGTDIMEEFYKDHTNDPDTKDKVIVDPFMGGGTTVVEALRLGCKVTGIDLNPVAWFIVKTEVEPVDIEELKKAFKRLSEREVKWSGKPLKETLLSLYKTECPGCGNTDADIIYTFWVKSAPCTTATCTSFTPLFSDYIIAKKTPTIRYLKDVSCPYCKEKFDWEREPASLIAEKRLMVNAGKFSAGEGRTSARWAYSDIDTVCCPWCNNDIKPTPKTSKLDKKKVQLTVLNCPHCEEVWQFRGPLTETVDCPTCKHKYNPFEGNIPEKGKFICRGTCGGNVDKIISAIRKHPANETLPVKPYAVEGYCEKCAKRKKSNYEYDDENEGYLNETLFGYGKPPINNSESLPDDQAGGIIRTSLIWKNNGKFFKRLNSSDLAKYKEASEIWEKEKNKLPYPKSEIPDGAETHRLLEHRHKYWHQMFNDRQLLGLSTLLKAIDEEKDEVMKEMLLSVFQGILEGNNVFSTYHRNRDCVGRIFARHDYQPKSTFLENNIWGRSVSSRNLISCWQKIIEGKQFNITPFDTRLTLENTMEQIFSKEYINGTYNSILICEDSKKIISKAFSVDLIITDPPYAGNVNYSELADFFYVWLRLILKNKYSHFAPEYTPKVEEIIENNIRGKNAEDFKIGLRSVFKETNCILKDEGNLIFTFHHSEGDTWESLLEALCEAGFYIEAVYPIHAESEQSLHLMDKSAISFDLIHVCKKIEAASKKEKRSWAGIRHEIRQRARDEVKLIESGRYGKGLSNPDVNILLIGKCLELYSKHYNKIIHHDKPLPLKDALEDIKLLVDQIITKENPIPSELEDVDTESYVYLTSLFSVREIKSDDVYKNTRGLIEPSKLKEAGLIIKGREKRGRSFEVKQPIERLNDLKEKFKQNGNAEQSGLFGNVSSNGSDKKILFVDYLHMLLGLAESGENLIPWLERFRGKQPQIRAALEHLIKNNRYTDQSKKVLALIEGTLFN